MKFMGDLPLSKHQKETDLVFTLLKVCLRLFLFTCFPVDCKTVVFFFLALVIQMHAIFGRNVLSECEWSKQVSNCFWSVKMFLEYIIRFVLYSL